MTYELTLDYLIYISNTLGCSRVKCKMAAVSFCFFFKHVLNKPYKIPMVLFPAHESKLPVVMSADEVYTTISGIKNIKHQTLFSLLYSTGMRQKEVAGLKIEHIDSAQMRIKIVQGKGRKDRFVPLSELLLAKLRAYYQLYKPEVFLFNGEQKGKPIHTRTIQHFVQKALQQAGLGHKQYTVHTIRHSFATHLLDQGVDLKAIQQLMGHGKVAQTMQYLHLSTTRMANIPNPYDQMIRGAAGQQTETL